jgi:hypothetical protein
VNHGGFTFIFLATHDAVAILDKHPNGKKLRNGRMIYPKMPFDKESVAKLETARCAAAPKPIATDVPRIAPAIQEYILHRQIVKVKVEDQVEVANTWIRSRRSL